MLRRLQEIIVPFIATVIGLWLVVVVLNLTNLVKGPFTERSVYVALCDEWPMSLPGKVRVTFYENPETPRDITMDGEDLVLFIPGWVRVGLRHYLLYGPEGVVGMQQTSTTSPDWCSSVKRRK
jgi:hypothetical protein